MILVMSYCVAVGTTNYALADFFRQLGDRTVLHSAKIAHLLSDYVVKLKGGNMAPVSAINTSRFQFSFRKPCPVIGDALISAPADRLGVPVSVGAGCSVFFSDLFRISGPPKSHLFSILCAPIFVSWLHESATRTAKFCAGSFLFSALRAGVVTRQLHSFSMPKLYPLRVSFSPVPQGPVGPRSS